MASVKKLILLAFIVQSVWQVAYSITCLSCGDEGVDQLSSCKQIVECAAGHACYIERALSLQSYTPKFKAGCRDVHECKLITCNKNAFGKTFLPHRTSPVPKLGKRDLVICTECCYNDTCNTKGCGANFTAGSSAGSDLLQCFQCTHQRQDSRPCSNFISCSSGESCMYNYMVHSDGAPFVVLGCVNTATCDFIMALTVGDRTIKCCDNHLCNQSPYKTANTSQTIFHTLPCPTGLEMSHPTYPHTLFVNQQTTTTPAPTTTYTTTTTTTPAPTTTTTTPAPTTTPTTTTTTTPAPTTTTTTPAPTTTHTTTTTTTPTTTTTTTPAPTTTTTTPPSTTTVGHVPCLGCVNTPTNLSGCGVVQCNAENEWCFVKVVDGLVNAGCKVKQLCQTPVPVGRRQKNSKGQSRDVSICSTCCDPTKKCLCTGINCGLDNYAMFSFYRKAKCPGFGRL